MTKAALDAQTTQAAVAPGQLVFPWIGLVILLLAASIGHYLLAPSHTLADVFLGDPTRERASPTTWRQVVRAAALAVASM